MKEICNKEAWFQFHQSHQSSSFGQTFIHIWSKPFSGFFVSCSERLLVSSGTLSSKRRNVSTLPVLVYIMYKNKQLLSDIKSPRAQICSVHYQGFKCFCWSILTSFISFIVSYCSLIWQISDVAPSERLSSYLVAQIILRLWFVYSVNFWKFFQFFTLLFLKFKQ